MINITALRAALAKAECARLEGFTHGCAVTNQDGDLMNFECAHSESELERVLDREYNGMTVMYADFNYIDLHVEVEQ